MVNGRIKVTVKDGDLSLANAKLIFSGEEYTVVQYNKTKGVGKKKKRVKAYARQRKNIVANMVVLPEILSEGSHEIPFQMVIPLALPSSFATSRAGKSSSNICQDHCSISYKFYMNSDESNTSWGIFKDKAVKHELNIEIIADPRQGLDSPVFIAPDVQKVSFCCCFDRGTIALAAKVDQAVMSKTKSFSVCTAYENQAIVDIGSVVVSLVERRWMKAGSKSAANSTTLATVTVAGSDLVGSAKAMAKGTILKEAANRLLDDLQNDRGASKHSVTISPTANALDSYCSNMIHIRHKIVIMLNTDSMMVSNPTIETDIVVQPDERVSAPPFPTVPPLPAPISPFAGMDAPLMMKADSFMFGGQALEDEEREEGEDDSASTNMLPSAFADVAASTDQNSVSSLIKEMEVSFNDYECVKKALESPPQDFKTSLSVLTPLTFAEIIFQTNFALDQPRVGALVGSKMNEFGGCFSTAHILAALGKITTGSFIKPELVDTLAPLAKDFSLPSSKESIKAQLSLSQQMSCKSLR